MLILLHVLVVVLCVSTSVSWRKEDLVGILHLTLIHVSIILA